MRKSIIFAMVTLMAVSVIGCKKDSKYDLDVSGVYIKNDLSLVGTFVEPFNKSYYNATELKLMVEDEIKAYNKEKVNVEAVSEKDVKDSINLPITLDDVAVKDKSAKVVITYDSGEDYISFNESYVIGEKQGTTLNVSLVSDGANSLEGEFVTEKGESVTIQDITKNGDYKLIYVDFGTTIKVEGKVCYISTNVTVEDKDTVTTVDGEGSFIIFN